MSYDVSIGDDSFNYTSNVAALFYDHIPAEHSRGGIHEIDGLTGRQAALVLGQAFCRMDNTRSSHWRDDEVGEPAFCARYDARNGWGSAIGGMIFLALIMDACVRYPRKRVRVHA